MIPGQFGDLFTLGPPWGTLAGMSDEEELVRQVLVTMARELLDAGVSTLDLAEFRAELVTGDDYDDLVSDVADELDE